MACRGLASKSHAFVNGGKLKPPRASTQSFDPLSSPPMSGRTRRCFSFFTPSSPTKGGYGRDGIEGQTSERNGDVHWGKDV
jgi:hypothetical protein